MATTTKTQRSPFEPWNDSDRVQLAKLPAGVPTLGLTWEEIPEYIEIFNDFRSSIFKGNLHSDGHHSWRAVARHVGPDGDVRMLVKEDGAIEAVEDYYLEAVKDFNRTGEFGDAGDNSTYFVIDDAFIVRAWTIGVHREGFPLLGGFDEADYALQVARWGFRNQG